MGDRALAQLGYGLARRGGRGPLAVAAGLCLVLGLAVHLVQRASATLAAGLDAIALSSNDSPTVSAEPLRNTSDTSTERRTDNDELRGQRLLAPKARTMGSQARGRAQSDALGDPDSEVECDGVYVYIVSFFPNVPEASAASLALGGQGQASFRRVGQSIGQWRVAAIFDDWTGLRPNVWLENGDRICRAALTGNDKRVSRVSSRQRAQQRAKQRAKKRAKQRAKRQARQRAKQRRARRNRR